MKRIPIEQVFRKFDDVDLIPLFDEYENQKEEVWSFCKNCEVLNLKRIINVFGGKGCKDCGIKRRTKSLTRGSIEE